ncbi:MAG: Rrf2 family transcriptional regulator [Pseudomonadota bacterium]
MRLSNQTNNAVKVLVHCAQAGGRIVTVPDIATSCGITEFNVFKLVPLLVKAGLLETIRGRSGGVRLNLAAEDISLGAVVRATESVFRESESSETEAGDTGADYSRMIDGAFLAFVEFLDQKSIAELADLEHTPADAASPQTDRPGSSAKTGMPK